jgi:hypothetical protein
MSTSSLALRMASTLPAMKRTPVSSNRVCNGATMLAGAGSYKRGRKVSTASGATTTTSTAPAGTFSSCKRRTAARALHKPAKPAPMINTRCVIFFSLI